MDHNKPVCCGEVVSNSAGGKDFYFCRGCKREPGTMTQQVVIDSAGERSNRPGLSGLNAWIPTRPSLNSNAGPCLGTLSGQHNLSRDATGYFCIVCTHRQALPSNIIIAGLPSAGPKFNVGDQVKSKITGGIYKIAAIINSRQEYELCDLHTPGLVLQRPWADVEANGYIVNQNPQNTPLPGPKFNVGDEIAQTNAYSNIFVVAVNLHKMKYSLVNCLGGASWEEDILVIDRMCSLVPTNKTSIPPPPYMHDWRKALHGPDAGTYTCVKCSLQCSTRPASVILPACSSP